jgi:hypothetical protein
MFRVLRFSKVSVGALDPFVKQQVKLKLEKASGAGSSPGGDRKFRDAS